MSQILINEPTHTRFQSTVDSFLETGYTVVPGTHVVFLGEDRSYFGVFVEFVKDVEAERRIERINGLVDALHGEDYSPAEIYLKLVRHGCDLAEAQAACHLEDEDVPPRSQI